jgi:hypothetical protein
MFAFTSEGIVFPTQLTCTDPFDGCELTALGTATATSGNVSPLPGPWLFTAMFSLVEPLSATTFRTVGVFSFDDPSPADNDFSGLLEGVFDALAFTNSMLYEITSGSGLFANASGFGSSLIQVIFQGENQPFAFIERGEFDVPEPDALALLALGVLWVALSRGWRMNRVTC